MANIKLAARTESGMIRVRPVVVDGVQYRVLKGIARNNRNKSWQVKVERNGVRLASGNFADEQHGGTDKALSAATASMLADLAEVTKNSASTETLHRKVRGGRVEGMRIADHVTVNWRIVNATPSLYASVYSPRLQQVKSLHLGSDRRLASSEEAMRRLVSQLLTALVMNDRVLQESNAPFDDVDEAEWTHDLALQAQTIFHSPEFKGLLNAGPALREYAEQARGAGFKLSKIV